MSAFVREFVKIFRATSVVYEANPSPVLLRVFYTKSPPEHISLPLLVLQSCIDVCSRTHLFYCCAWGSCWRACLHFYRFWNSILMVAAPHAVGAVELVVGRAWTDAV